MPPAITSWTQGAWIALDIILVALLIYQVLVMIRGTRAVPMLVGLTVLAILFYFAQIGELTTLNWVVSRVLPYVVFALIVVFQSEIRHVLTDLGRRLTFLGGSNNESDSYDDIVLAANLFSQHQTGALIVIERDLTVEQLRDRLGAELQRHMTAAALPTPIAQNIDDESDAALRSPFTEPAPNRKSEQGPQSESL